MSEPKSQDAHPSANVSRRSPSPESGPRSTSPWRGTDAPAQVRSATPAYPLPAAQSASAPAPGVAAATRTLTPANTLAAASATSSPAVRSTTTTQILTPSVPTAAVPVLVAPNAAATRRTLTPANQNAAAVTPAGPAPATFPAGSGASGGESPKTLLLDGSMLEVVRARAAAVAAAASPEAPVRTSTPAMPQPAPSPPAPPTTGTAISVRTARYSPAVSQAVLRPAQAEAIPAAYQVVPAKIEPDHFELPKVVDPHLPMLTEEGGERAAAFRALRRRLAEQKDPRAILVTSAQGDEGKTTCAANLALALAESGRLSVLLVEANLRRPKLSAIFGFQPARCMRTQLAAHREQIEAPWLTTELRPSGLHVLALAPEGGGNENLHGPTFSASIARWRRVFDYMVIDGPSILESCDASIIHDSVDAVVMVARSGVSRNRTVKRALEQISADMVAGVVLMDSTTR